MMRGFLLVLFCVGFQYQPEQPGMVLFEGKTEKYPASLSVSFNPVTEEVYVLQNAENILLSILPDGNHQILDTLSFPGSDEYHYIEYSEHDSLLYFWEVGVGEVYQYDLKARDLQSVSDTKVDGLMYAHGGFIGPDGHIYAQSGYGYWQMHNLLLRFESQRGEWFLESNEFPLNDMLSEPHTVWFDESEGGMYYLSHPEEAYYQIAFYDPEDKTWDLKYRLSAEKEFEYTRHIYKRSTYATDHNRHITHLYGDLLINTSEQKFYSVVNDENRFLIFGMFYVSATDEWIIYGRDKEINDINLTVKRVSANALDLSEIDTNYYVIAGLHYGHITWIGGITGMLLIVGFIIYGFSRRSPDPGRSNPDERVLINVDQIRLQVTVDGIEVPLTDEFIYNTWSLILKMKRTGSTVLTLRDFDEWVFPGDHSDSYYAKKRKKILNEINQTVGEQLITTTPNSLDKRAKDILIHHQVVGIVGE